LSKRIIRQCIDCDIMFEIEDLWSRDQCEKCHEMSLEAEGWHYHDFAGTCEGEDCDEKES